MGFAANFRRTARRNMTPSQWGTQRTKSQQLPRRGLTCSVTATAVQLASPAAKRCLVNTV
jgi:hypothetical protein